MSSCDRASELHLPEATVVHMLSFSARISTTCRTIHQDLNEIYLTSASDGGRSSGSSVRLSVTRCCETGGSHKHRYRIYKSGRAIRAPGSRSEVLGHLESLIDVSAMRHVRIPYMLVHAGAVAIGADAIVIPADSGAGKSTLVAALCQSGFSYLSDEIAVLDMELLSVRPFPKAICLKDEGWELLNSCYSLPSAPATARRPDGNQVRFLPAPYSHPMDDATRIRYLVLPMRERGATAELTPISRGHALAELVKHSLNLPLHGEQGLEALIGVVEQANCFSLTYDDLGSAVATVSSLWGAEGPEPRPAASQLAT